MGKFSTTGVAAILAALMAGGCTTDGIDKTATTSIAPVTVCILPVVLMVAIIPVIVKMTAE